MTELRTIITFPNIMKVCAACAILAGVLWYGHFQARSFIAGPQIELQDPTATLQTTQTVSVRGHAYNVTELQLNGKMIHSNEDGYFDESLVLPDGYTIMTLHAKDRYGRTTVLSRPLIYEPPTNISSI